MIFKYVRGYLEIKLVIKKLKLVLDETIRVVKEKKFVRERNLTHVIVDTTGEQIVVPRA